jgi:hypothetical protein
MPSRNRIILLAVIAGLLIVIFFVGVGVGAGRHNSAADVTAWRAHLNGLNASVNLRATDLQVHPNCQPPVGSTIQIGGSCQIGIPAVGRLALRGSRRLVLEATTLSVIVNAVVEGQTETQTLSPGETISLTFGREADQVDLACDGPSPCPVRVVT